MTGDNFCSYLQNSLIQTSQTEGHRYSDASPFSILCNIISDVVQAPKASLVYFFLIFFCKKTLGLDFETFFKTKQVGSPRVLPSAR
jgi:hypothetical protein